MENITQKRQLAAIMPARRSSDSYRSVGGPACRNPPAGGVGRFTDIVGYTALMGESEEKALHTRRINREIHQQQIEAVGGTWLKEMGLPLFKKFIFLFQLRSFCESVLIICPVRDSIMVVKRKKLNLSPIGTK
jgi:hypothetical protein